MALRAVPLTDHAGRILLEGIVDYAGLFPPAAVSMAEATRNFAHYRASGAGWMLGRFVCPANALEQFSTVADPLLPRDAGALPWRLTVTGSGDTTADMSAIDAFNARHVICFDDRGALVDGYETKAASLDAVYRIDATVPPDLETYIEVPFGDPSEAMLSGIARTGRRAKMRTGGVVPDAFPRAESVIAFLARAIALGVPCKATAGLHHPICGTYRLTYEPDAPTGRMFGFLNLFLASALLLGGGSPGEATVLLGETDAGTLETNDQQVAWRGPEGVRVFDRALLQRVRESVLTSFGSCSFTEPVEESRALGLL